MLLLDRYKAASFVVQAFAQEEELLKLLGEVETAANQARRGIPVSAQPGSAGDLLPALAPLIVQQTDALMRAATAGVPSLALSGGDGANMFCMFARDRDRRASARAWVLAACNNLLWCAWNTPHPARSLAVCDTHRWSLKIAQQIEMAET